jgi:hypothetical protein
MKRESDFLMTATHYTASMVSDCTKQEAIKGNRRATWPSYEIGDSIRRKYFTNFIFKHIRFAYSHGL